MFLPVLNYSVHNTRHCVDRGSYTAQQRSPLGSDTTTNI